MSRRPTRRQIVAGVGAVGAAGAAALVLRSPPEPPETPAAPVADVEASELRAMRGLLKKLPGVTISEDAQLRWLATRRTLVGKPFRLPKKRRHKLARQLLLSTDFFQTGMKPDRPARWVAWYDPYVTPCYSPFRT